MKIMKTKLVFAALFMGIALTGCHKDSDSSGENNKAGAANKNVPVTSVPAPASQPAALPADTSIGTPANPAGMPAENEAMPAPTGVNGMLINSGTDTINSGTGSINNNTKQTPSATDSGDQD